jgi:hypothetical protein
MVEGRAALGLRQQISRKVDSGKPRQRKLSLFHQVIHVELSDIDMLRSLEAAAAVLREDNRRAVVLMKQRRR